MLWDSGVANFCHIPDSKPHSHKEGFLNKFFSNDKISLVVQKGKLTRHVFPLIVKGKLIITGSFFCRGLKLAVLNVA